MVGPLGWIPISLVSRIMRALWMDLKYLGDYNNFIEHQKLNPLKRQKQVITLTAPWLSLLKNVFTRKFLKIWFIQEKK